MKGKSFENLVAWISSCLHAGEVLHNQKLTDIHTGKKRQVDVLIKVKDGPTELTGIIEARERSRPVGVEYIEQIHAKKMSVGVDFAVIVSNKGFYASAAEKAALLGIRVFSLEEALVYNWSLSNTAVKINAQIFHTENTEIKLFDKQTRELIVPSALVLAELSLNPQSLLLKSKEGEPLAHLPTFTNAFQKFLQPHLKAGKKNGGEFLIYFDLVSKPQLYLETSNNESVLIECFSIRSFCWIEEKEIVPLVTQYKSPNSDKLTAEIMSIDLTNGIERVEILTNNPNDIDTDRNVSVRSTRVDGFVPPKTKTEFWFTVSKVYQFHEGKFYRMPLNNELHK